MGLLSQVLGANSVSRQKVTAALEQALQIGAERAVRQLSTAGGYGNDPQRRIRLPGDLDDVAKALRRFGACRSAR